MLLISGWERRKRRTQRPFAVAAARAHRQQCRVPKSEYVLACRRSESDKQAQCMRTRTDKQRCRCGPCRRRDSGKQGADHRTRIKQPSDLFHVTFGKFEFSEFCFVNLESRNVEFWAKKQDTRYGMIYPYSKGGPFKVHG